MATEYDSGLCCSKRWYIKSEEQCKQTNCAVKLVPGVWVLIEVVNGTFL